jgi:hypothetical protein
LSETNPTRIGLGLNPELRGRKYGGTLPGSVQASFWPPFILIRQITFSSFVELLSLIEVWDLNDKERRTISNEERVHLLLASAAVPFDM